MSYCFSLRKDSAVLSSSNKFAIFSCVLSKAAEEKRLGVYMNSYMLKPHLAKKFISEMEKGGLLASRERAGKARNMPLSHHGILSLESPGRRGRKSLTFIRH